MPACVTVGLPRVVAFLLLALLSACSARPPLPEQLPHLTLPNQWHVQSNREGQQRDWLLVIQTEASGLRFSLFNPLGVPLARQLLIDQKWQAEGLLPPFAEARELFAASLFALTSASELPQLYPTAQTKPQRQLGEHWRIEYLSQDAFIIHHASTAYRFSPLPTETAP